MSKKKVFKKTDKKVIKTFNENFDVIETEKTDYLNRGEEVKDYSVIWIDGDELQLSYCPTELALEELLDELNDGDADPEELNLNSKVVVIRGDVEGLRISSYKKYVVE